jgi:hypothetical protein
MRNMPIRSVTEMPITVWTTGILYLRMAGNLIFLLAYPDRTCSPTNLLSNGDNVVVA